MFRFYALLTIPYTLFLLVVCLSLIEEFMLLANSSVAIKLFESYPKNALLRNHPSPKENLLKTAFKTVHTSSLFPDNIE